MFSVYYYITAPLLLILRICVRSHVEINSEFKTGWLLLQIWFNPACISNANLEVSKIYWITKSIHNTRRTNLTLLSYTMFLSINIAAF